MFRYLFERLCALSQDILDLLEQVDAFPFNQLGYSLGQSPYQSLGDLHDSLENVYVKSNAGTRTHTVRMTIRKVRELFEEWTREVERMRAHNDRIYQQMGQCQSQEEWERLRAKLIPDDECPQPKILERVLDEHANEPDNTEVDVETTHYLDGYYSRNTNQPVQGYVVLRFDTRKYPLVCTYIHEMMHAFYDADLSQTHNDAEYAEEPLAEYGMLHFVESFVRSHPEHADMLTYAKEYVRKKQSNFGIAHYGFGAYLYEHFQHIEWEQLMRDAHSQINNSIAPYTDLKDALNGVYSSATQLPRVAQLLHDVLTDANGQAQTPIRGGASKRSSVTRRTPQPSQSAQPRTPNTSAVSTTTEPPQSGANSPTQQVDAVSPHRPLSPDLSNTLLDNSENFCMAEYLKAVLQDERCTEMKIATGYWDLPGMKEIEEPLRAFLERGGKIQLLLGEEPCIRPYQMDEQETTRDPQFPGFYIQRDIDRLNEDYVSVATLLHDYIKIDDEENSPIQVRVYGKEGERKFLHAKCYICLGTGYAKGIIGSSNFTKKGLLENAELNYLETNTLVVTAPDNRYANTKSHLTWFDEKWEEGTPWTGEFATIIDSTPGRTPKALTPYEVYIMLLQDRFAKIVDDTMENKLISYLNGTIYTPIDYQLDAVKDIYDKMQRMGGFMLSDVVGLGKTICGVMLIKYYLEHVDASKQKVLIVTPPAIKHAWLDTLDEFNKGVSSPQLIIGQNIDFVTTGSLEKLEDSMLVDSQEDFENDNEDGVLSINQNTDYSLIIIDESHKFRNSTTRMYEALQTVIAEIELRTGTCPYVGLISATPQNNQPSDIQNQILLFEHEPRNSHFDKIPNRDFQAFFGNINRSFGNLRQQAPATVYQQLMDISQEVRDKVLESIMVRRTRTDIMTHYGNGNTFPEIVGPVRLQYLMDNALAQTFSDTMNAIDRGGTLQYARYRAIEELTSANQERYVYGSMTVQKSADALAGIIRILLVKRLESSFDAFQTSLKNEKKRIENMLQMIADDCIFICPNLDVNAELDIAAKQVRTGTPVTYATCYQDIRNAINRLTAAGRNTRNQNAEFHRRDFTNIGRYEMALRADLAIIDGLITDWGNVTTDPKLDEFVQRLQDEIMQPDSVRMREHLARLSAKESQLRAIRKTTEADAIRDEINRLNAIVLDDTLERKLVIFSEAIDTVNKLETECTNLGYRVLKVTAANRNAAIHDIKANFDANAPIHEQDDAYDIIITTEVLAEGINLHRANAIVNYDSPWNATKLIQRIGRVNRIGSIAPAVFVYNFHPSAQGNTVIQLVENAYRKLQSFHVMFGGDNAIFSDTEEVISYSNALNGAPSPLQPYIAELREYKTNHPARYKQLESLLSQETDIATDAISIVSANHQTQETLCAIRQGETMYVLVKDDGGQLSGEIVPTLEALEICKCQENAPTQDLSNVNIAQIKAEAMQVFINYKNTLTAQQQRSQIFTQALGDIRTINAQHGISQQSQQYLVNADQLIRGGNRFVAKSIHKLAEDINAKSTSTLPYTPADIDNMLADLLAKVAARGITILQPTHFISFNKQ